MPKLATAKVNLTKLAIEALQPRGSSYLVHDTVQRGLCVKVRSTGSKTFLVYKSVAGKPVKVTIGRWPEWNVVAARTRAAKIVSDLVQGPREVKKVIPTLKDLFAKYTGQLVADGSRHPDYVDVVIKTSWKGLLNRKVDDIGRVEVQEIHNRIATTRGRVAAARSVKMLRTLYNYAIDLEFSPRNPAKLTRIQDSKSRDVFLNTDDLV